MDCCIGSVEEDDMEVLENSGPVEAMKRNRKCTDKGFIFGMAAFILILFGFLGFCIANGDLDRIINGFDDCGNICGKNNVKTDSTSSVECYGKNMENKKYLLYQRTFTGRFDDSFYRIEKICVENCEAHNAHIDFFNRCSSEKPIMTDLQKIFKDFQKCWMSIVLLSFLAIVLSIILMVLMRFATAFLVWFILASIALASIGLTAKLWSLYSNLKTKMDDDYYNINNYTKYLVYLPIISTILTFVFLLIVLVMAKRIKLVIQLFKEAAKVIAAIPLLLLQPVVTFMVICFMFSIYIYMNMWIITSGHLEKSWDGSFNYNISTIQIVTSCYNFVAFLWIVQFLIGCQNIIIAGSVATWFFARNKENLGTPIITSTLNLVRYHLGTVAVGSLIITIVQIIRLMMLSLQAATKRIVLFLFMFFSSEVIEDFIKYFTKNSYIITAVYGSPFCVSGKRAVNLIAKNIFSVVAINSVGDYILFFIKLFVTIFTVYIGNEVFRQYDGINLFWFPLACVGIISYLIAHCFVTVFEMAVDTIFLCFCEDCEANDGDSNPFFMSRDLMKFIKNTNYKKWTELQQKASNTGPEPIMLQELQSAS